MQIEEIKKEIDRLQKIHGAKKLYPVYGAGKIHNPKVMFVFMNPTAKNVSAFSNWDGIRAPWIGTKNIWKLFFDVGVIRKATRDYIMGLSPKLWTPMFAKHLYGEIVSNDAYITNLAKCTQEDARPLNDAVFKKYLDVMLEEIDAINPEKIITFGNQVSSILLNKKISVGDYKFSDYEKFGVSEKIFKIYPVYYPVGQGMRNMPLAVERIRGIMGG